MTSPTDRELALRALNGENQAYGELVRRYQDSVYNVCYRLIGERREAEDMAQEAFLRAYERFSSYDSARPFGPWIRRVAANHCRNQLQACKQAEYPLDDERDAPGLGRNSPENLHERAENAQAIRSAILVLPPHYRAVIELRHFQELSYAEIAAALGMPLSDVKSRLFRARRELRRILEKKLESYG